MHACTGFGDSAACRITHPEVPRKPTEKMFQVWLYQPVPFTSPLSAQAAWHSPPLTQGQRQAQKTSCQETRHSAGPRRPHNAHQLLLSKPFECQELPDSFQEDSAHPKENESQLTLRPKDLRLGLHVAETRPVIDVKATEVRGVCVCCSWENRTPGPY